MTQPEELPRIAHLLANTLQTIRLRNWNMAQAWCLEAAREAGVTLYVDSEPSSE